MRIFKALQLLQQHFYVRLPCLLCQSAVANSRHNLCVECWQQLPWVKQSVLHENFHLQVACDYQFPISRIIPKFKYEQQLQYAPLLAQLLLSLKIGKVQAIVPMPISHQRLAERGYNQVMLLAKILSEQLNVPIWQPISRKNEHAQKGLSGVERRQNIEQQFYFEAKPKLRFRRVLMLDDVITTGSSLNALAKQLQLLGCKDIYAVCVATAQHHSSFKEQL